MLRPKRTLLARRLFLSAFSPNPSIMLTESQVRAFQTNRTLISRASLNTKTASPLTADKTVFLSHAHQDSDIAEGIATYLKSLGVAVYIDWKDASMPPQTNGETATRIKQRIRRADVFLLACTNKACESRWCPWELGVADDSKSRDNILILPISDGSGTFKGNEYLQIYRKVTDTSLLNTKSINVAGLGKLAVFEPGSNSGKFIDNYIMSR